MYLYNIMEIKKFWKDIIWDSISNKVSSKKLMAIISFIAALILIFGNSWFNFKLDYVALGSLLTMSGFNAVLSANEKIKIHK